MYKKIILGLSFLLFGLFSKAAIVDTVSIYSEAMHKNIKCVVIRPKTKQALPVVYLLHGYSGAYWNWIARVPALKKQADELQLIIVCPDGAYSGWYFDSPIDPTMQYETYISKEVPAYIDTHYKTIRNRNARAITGLSMGGHGGLFLGFRHADFFGACGSMSGAVDLNGLKSKYEITKLIGDTISMANNWINYSTINVIEKYPKDSIAIIFDCGVDDFFYKDNQNLHKKMLALKIPHDYTERPGKHDWAYWGNAVEYQLLYFRNFFDKYYPR